MRLCVRVGEGWVRSGEVLCEGGWVRVGEGG